MTRNRRGNWERDYRTAMRNGIPEERRRLLVNRGVLPQDDDSNDLDTNVSGEAIINTNPYVISCDLARDEETTTTWGDFMRLRESNYGMRAMSGTWVNPYSTPSKSFKYIKSYNYKPDKFNFNKIYGSEDINPYLGIELEIDSAGKNDDNAKLVIDTLGGDNVYCVHDGSLSDGFEIVTHPCTLDYHSNLEYKVLFKKLIELGYKSHDTTTCGLHIHFNKNYFGESRTIQDLCITKLLYLFEKYWDNIAKFSRRNNNKYTSRYGMEENDSMFEVLYKAKAARESYNGRYRSINLKNENTVEIRVFKGTLKYNTFIATLQFVNRLVTTCRELSLEDIQLITWNDIVKNAEEELRQYLIERKLI